jgi:hypothetical protein
MEQRKDLFPYPGTYCQLQEMGAVNNDSLRRESLDAVGWHRIISESQGGRGGSRMVSSRFSFVHLSGCK